MADRSLVLGGTVVVVLSGVAAFVGARMGAPAPFVESPLAPAGKAASGVDDVARRRLDNVERRLDLLEVRAGGVPETNETAAPAQPKPIYDGPSKPPGAAAATDGTAPAAPPKSQEEILKEAALVTGRARLTGIAALMSDATPTGIENRRKQAAIEAARIEISFREIDDEKRRRLREVLQEQWDRDARDIGPLVRDGVERTDVVTVKQRMTESWAETDRQLKELLKLNEQSQKTYEAAVETQRHAVRLALDEAEHERLYGKR